MRGRPRPRSLPAGDAEVRRGADRADPRDALSPLPHRRHPPGLGARQRGDPRAQRRGRPHAGRHPGQRARPSRTCGCGTATRCSRPSGSSRRSAPTTISSRWTTTATGSTGATGRSCSRRASSTPASLPTRTFINEHLTFTHGMGLTLGPVNQVTPEGLPGAVRQGPAAGLDRLAQGHPPADLLRRARQRVRLRGDPAARVRPSVRRGERLRRSTPAPAASRSATSCAGSCSPSGSARRRSCSRRTSPTRAGCSTTGTSPSGRRRRCRSSGSTAIRTS